MVASVEHSWARIKGWLSANAPGHVDAIAPPANPQAIEAVERTLGVVLPEDLRQWWLQADGASGEFLYLPPGCTPCSTADALSDRRMRLDSCRTSGMSTAAGGLAGDPSLPYLDLYLTIAEDHCGGYLFVDLRDGPRRGGVGFCSGEENHEAADWDSIAHLLEAVADAMDAGVPCMAGQLLPEPDADFGVEWNEV